MTTEEILSELYPRAPAQRAALIERIDEIERGAELPGADHREATLAACESARGIVDSLPHDMLGAVVYAKPGGAVRIKWGRGSNHAKLRVHDRFIEWRLEYGREFAGGKFHFQDDLPDYVTFAIDAVVSGAEGEA